MQRLAFRIILKLMHWVQSSAVRHLGDLAASHGSGAVATLLQACDGDNACRVLRSSGAKVGEGTRVSRGLVLHNADDGFMHLQIGHDCHLGRQLLLDLAAPVTIGNRVTISMRAMILTHTDVGDSGCGVAKERAGVTIDDDVYIGAGAMLLPGVHIGERAVVGAGAVVTRDIPAGATVAGIPARALRSVAV